MAGIPSPKVKLQEIWFNPDTNSLYRRTANGYTPLAATTSTDVDFTGGESSITLAYSDSALYAKKDASGAYVTTGLSVFFTVLVGFVDKTSSCTFSASCPDGITGHWGEGADASRWYLDSMTTKGLVEISANYEGFPLGYDLLIGEDYERTDIRLNTMKEVTVVTPMEKPILKVKWADINGDGSTTGSYWQTRTSALQLNISTAMFDYYFGNLNATMLSVLDTGTWNDNILIPSDFTDMWAGYYRIEAQMLVTITHYSSYGTVERLDCGDWDSINPEFTPALDGGTYVSGIYDDYYDNGDYTAITADIDLDCSDYTSSGAVDGFDSGDFLDFSTPVLLIPDVTVDCGDF